MSFYPSFRMYFNLLALLVHTSLIMKRAPVFRTGSLTFVAFNLNKMGEHWVPAKSVLHAAVNGLSIDDVSLDSRVVASKLHMPHDNVTPLVTPIYHSSLYKVKSVDHYLDIVQNGGYIYSRLGNPTCESVEAAVHALEGGAGTLLFATGMGAISTTLSAFLKAGDHVVAINPLCSGTHKYMSKFLTKFNIEISWVPAGCSVEEYKKSIKPNTKVLFGETPCNPLISILDLEEFGKLGRDTGILTMVDSTYGSPYLQQPMKYGIDFSIHSATKYLGGHSDLCAGVVTCRTVEQWRELNIYRTTLGNVLSPFDASLLARGMKTLHVRMERHSFNAQKLAEYLVKHPKVDKVYYPGLKKHPGHDVACKQMKSFSGMIAFEMKDGLKPAKRLVEAVRLIQFTGSLGCVESLIEHPASMSHGPMIMDDAERAKAWIKDGLIRFSVGIEDVDDLITDLDQALAKA